MCDGSGFEYSQLLIPVPARSELSVIGFFILFFLYIWATLYLYYCNLKRTLKKLLFHSFYASLMLIFFSLTENTDRS